MSDRILVISGMSGAGKSSALRAFEDLGYYCVDNLPPPLINTFVDLCIRAAPRRRQLAIAIDARTGEFLEQFGPAWEQLCERAFNTRLLFLDAEDAVLGQRFSETRRPHPLAPKGSVKEGVAREREVLASLRERAHEVIDSSTLTVHSLRELLIQRYGGGEGQDLNVAVASFAYRHGVLDNADLVFDVRFLANPHYDPTLRPLTGLDTPVTEFIESRPATREFLEHLERLLLFLLPRYREEGKTYLTVAFGCTGGRHRSVAIAERVAALLRSKGFPTNVTHVDLDDAQPARRAAR